MRASWQHTRPGRSLANDLLTFDLELSQDRIVWLWRRLCDACAHRAGDCGARWISEQTFTDIVAISQMTPGPIGINSATYIGYVAPGISDQAFSNPVFGVIGSIICTLVVIIPSFVLVTSTEHFIRRHKERRYSQGCSIGAASGSCGPDSFSCAPVDECGKFR